MVLSCFSYSKLFLFFLSFFLAVYSTFELGGSSKPMFSISVPGLLHQRQSCPFGLPTKTPDFNETAPRSKRARAIHSGRELWVILLKLPLAREQGFRLCGLNAFPPLVLVVYDSPSAVVVR